MQNINKFSKLAILFTIFYILFGQFIMSEKYEAIAMVNDWFFWTIFILYLGFMLGSVIAGFLAIKQAYKAQERWKWLIMTLTLFNAIVLVLNIITE